MIGAVLLAVPVAHFFACGYIYEIINRARRGEPLDLPEWDDWRRLFTNGVAAFMVFVVFTLVPLSAGWVLTRPLYWLGAGWFSYMPLMPVLLVCFPLTAASLYLYQKREDYRDALRPWVLLRMLSATGLPLVVPTLALVGLLVTGLPFMTFTLFVGFCAAGAFYSARFQAVEAALKSSALRR